MKNSCLDDSVHLLLSLSSVHIKAASLVEKMVLGDLNKISKYSPFVGFLSIFVLEITLKVISSSYISIYAHYG